MPDDTFYRAIVALIERRRWGTRTAEDIDRDVQLIIEASIDVYLNGRKPPPPRPNSPLLLFSVHSLSGLFDLCRPRRRSVRVRRRR